MGHISDSKHATNNTSRNQQDKNKNASFFTIEDIITINQIYSIYLENILGTCALKCVKFYAKSEHFTITD